MRIFLIRVIVAIATTCFFNIASADNPATSNLSWHTQPQLDRGMAVVNRALVDNGHLVGVSCKKWAQNVIFSASSGHVWLPLNENPPYDFMWKYDSTGHTVPLGIPIQDAQIGDIVQMKLTSGGPHTAIVVAITSTYLIFAESNWDSTPDIENDAYAHLRLVTFSKFYSEIYGGGSYMIYRIL